MTINLFPFQAEDVNKLASQQGVLIANEMGTGKTYEAIARDGRLRAEDVLWKAPKRTLVVVSPMVVTSVWKAHLEALTSLPVTILDPKNRSKSLTTFLDGGDGYFVMHYEALRLLVDEMKDIYWFHTIADECHRIKNRKAQQTAAFKKIKTKYRTAMSGTPAVNRPDELWSVLNWLKPEEYRSYWTFYRRYVDYEIIYPQGFHKVTGPKNVEELQCRISDYYVRHLKKEPCCAHHPQGVLPQLPDKVYDPPLWVELSGPQRTAYNQMRKEMIAWIGQNENKPLVAPVVIAQLIRLQQFAVAHADIVDGHVELSEPSSKLDALMELLEAHEGEQVVVFSQFKQLVDLCNKRLEAAGIPYVTLTGDVKPELRPAAVAKFQSGMARVFTGTITAGGVGVDLYAASTVVFLDRGWSPASNQQAEDRLHRHGQKDTVQVCDIMARNTIDFGRKQKIDLKWSWIKELLGDD
jgi:SNF2 family DNA or RNA helicase